MHERETFYAHTLDGKPPEDWELLEEHLSKVAELAAQFADAFGAAVWGRLAGRWHDLGKYRQEFQARLLGSGVAVEHSGVGAALAVERGKEAAIPLALVIAGHHAGLANLVETGPGLPTPLKERLRENQTLIEQVLPKVPTDISDHPLPSLPQFLGSALARDRQGEMLSRRMIEFWTRFLFSALVDADRLGTEAFCQPTRSALRCRFASVSALRGSLDQFVECLAHDLPEGRRGSPLNDSRAFVLRTCRESAELQPGFFSLDAPTGSGKTLASMSFALRHAERHGLRRAIVVLPYTSIIEQNADVYRRALGAENVVEHHSSLDPEQRRRVFGEEVTTKHELAVENWDAPVVVTTTVQFFESLFSNHPSRCRKLHNVASSVVILDEVQALPPQFLLPIVEALNELVSHYGCTVLLSTATPPALAARASFPLGLRGVRQIIVQPQLLNAQLQRAEYRWPKSDGSSADWADLAEEVVANDQALVVVHRRGDARLLARALMRLVPRDSVFHLSALMCASHRSDRLEQVRQRLAQGLSCLLVSTQLVEAGVDVDFPVVYRALGGLDSIVQAAGRCNRERRLQRGRVVVFRACTEPPLGTPRRALEVTESLLREHGGTLDLSDPRTFNDYFRMLYAAESLDARQIQVQRQELNFASVGRDFRLIEDGFTTPIVVPYGEAAERLHEIRQSGPTRENLRAIQRFLVNIYPGTFSALRLAGGVEEVAEGVFALSLPFQRYYDPVLGLAVDGDLKADPEALVV